MKKALQSYHILILFFFISNTVKAQDKQVIAPPALPLPVITNQNTNINKQSFNGKNRPGSRKSIQIPCAFKTPFENTGCPGEGSCIVVSPIAIGTTKVFERPDLKSKVIDQINKGDNFNSTGALTIIQNFGLAEIASVSNNSKDDYVIGDKLVIISYSGEGYYEVCNDKTKLQLSTGYEDGQLGIIVKQEPKYGESWIKVKTKLGTVGYAPNIPFYEGKN